MDFVMPSVMPSDDDSKLTEAYRKLRESEVTKDDKISEKDQIIICLLYSSDAADE